MQDVSKIKELFVYTDGKSNWQVDWKEAEEDKLRFIQEICPLLNNADYKQVCEAVRTEFGITMPTKKELADMAAAENEKLPKRKQNRRGFVAVYFIKDYQKIN